MIETSHDQTINKMTHGAIQLFYKAIPEENEIFPEIFKSLRNASQQISSQYVDRFLIELVQNAHDAHKRGNTAGEVAIRLCPEEGDHGVLYVANKGEPFSQKDVHSICNLALSSKPPGEAIGNKGLGFRSVLSVSNNPEIYSKRRSGKQHRFDGFCFRFADRKDLDRLIPDKRQRELAETDLPPLLVPISIPYPHRAGTKRGEVLTTLAKQGFSSVIRLPLSRSILPSELTDLANSDNHQNQVLRAIQGLRRVSAPLLAFLPRLSKLKVTVVGRPSLNFEVKRNKTASDTIGKDSFESTTFSDTTTSDSTTLFIATREIPEESVREAIEQSISKGMIDLRWGDTKWSGTGEVAIALSLGSNEVTPQFYNYFPMGPEAQAPLQGLIHAGFFTQPDRRSMSERIPLNELYLTEAVKLAATTIKLLRRDKIKLSEVKDPILVGQLIVDLLCWSDRGQTESLDFPKLAMQALEALSLSPDKSNLFPIMSKEGGTIGAWASGQEIASWSHYEGNEEISLDNLVKEAGVKVIHPHLGDDRIKRLEAFLSQVRVRPNLDPNEEIQAGAVAILASQLKGFKRKGTKNHKRWCTFYHELGGVLIRVRDCFWKDKKILLCQDAELRNSELSSKVPVFFPRNDGSLTIPPELRSFFGVLDSRLDWSGQELKLTHDLLKSKLSVRDFDSRELIEGTAQIPLNNNRRTAILRWVFEIWSQSGGHALLEDVDIEVPVLGGGWKKAKEVFFSRGWPRSTHGTLMHSLLSNSGEKSELFKLKGRQLAAPSAKPFDRTEIAKWTDFLQELRVTKGLPVERIGSVDRPIYGTNLDLQNNPEDAVCSLLNLGDNTKEYLARQIVAAGERGGIEDRHKHNSYGLRYEVSYIPGQEDFNTMSASVKETFAELLINLLPSLGDSASSEHLITLYPLYLQIRIKETSWPSPAIAFLREAEWIPMQSNGDGQEEYFTAPSKVMIVDPASKRFSTFLPSPVQSIRRVLQEEIAVSALRDVCDAVIYGADGPRIKQVQLMANLFACHHISVNHAGRFETEYWATWSKVINETKPRSWTWLEEGEKTTLYRVNGQLTALPITNDVISQHGIYVRDEADELKPQLLDKLGRCVWGNGRDTLDDPAEYLAFILSNDLVQLVSNVHIAPFIDGTPADTAPGKYLTELIPCITEIIARCVVSKSKSVDQQYLDASKDIQIKGGNSITVSIQDEQLPLPPDTYGSLFLETANSRTVLLEDLDVDNPTWDLLVKASKSIAQGIGNEEVSESLTLAFETINDQFGNPLQAVASAVNWERVDTRLKLTDFDKATVKIALRGNDEQAAEYLRVLAAYHLGYVEADRIWEESLQIGIEVLNARLVKAIESKIPSDTRLLDQLSMARGFRDVFDLCRLDSLKEFNDALVQLDKEPLDFGDEHADSLKTYIANEYDEVIRPIREAFLSEFRSFGSLDEYVNGRDAITDLKPDPSWAREFSELGDGQLKAYIRSTLKNLGLPAGAAGTLRSLLEIQDPNRAMVRKTIDASVPVVEAWCVDNGKILHSLWTDPDQHDVAVNNFEMRGILDFELLDEKSTMKWLAKLGYWPDTMGHSTDRNCVGLSSEDSDDVSQHADDLKREKQRERRITKINNGKFELEHGMEPIDHLRELFAKAIKKNLHLLPDPGSVEEMSTRRSRQRTNPGQSGSGRGRSNERPTPEKLLTIGLLGELFVYEWLKQKMPKRDHGSMWVSTYAQRVLGKDGDDRLGYDFTYRTGRGKRNTFIEVKSHLKDPKEIELGESEVRKAHECANGPSEGDYQIAYVSFLERGYGDIAISLLPNPYSEDGRSRFHPVRTGQKFRFRLS